MPFEKSQKNSIKFTTMDWNEKLSITTQITPFSIITNVQMIWDKREKTTMDIVTILSILQIVPPPHNSLDFVKFSEEVLEIIDNDNTFKLSCKLLDTLKELLFYRIFIIDRSGISKQKFDDFNLCAIVNY